MSTLKTLRTQSGRTQVELAREAGLSEGTVQKLERGEVLPSYRTLQLLKRVLGDQVMAADFNNNNKRDRGRQSREARNSGKGE